jgi:hypothetical protein
MSDSLLDELEQATKSAGPGAAIDKLVETLRQRREYDRLFDALLVRKRFEMGLPLARPTSLDVPEGQRKEFEDAYVAAAREVGELFLKKGDLRRAWPYLRTIGESDTLRQALDAMEPPREPDERAEELIELCLNQGAHPAKGLEIMLHTHGTCNTITAFEQALQAQILNPDDQRRAARMLVNELYGDLCRTVGHEVKQRLAMVPPGESLRELIAGRDWLFADDNYHIDVSHLNATVRFARSFDADTPELSKVLQLAEYGSKLAPQFQYAGDPPFDEFYPAHVHYFRALLGEDPAEQVAYFRGKLEAEPDEQDQPYLAFELVTLLIKMGRRTEAVDVAGRYLKHVNDPNGFSFPQLCLEAGRVEAWREAAREQGDPVGYAAALAQQAVK